MITVNYNDSDTTSKFINSAYSCNFYSLIIVVDNCSTDDSYSILKTFENDVVKVIKSEHNGGYGYGNNFGARYLFENHGKDFIITISNPDIEFEADILNILTKQFELRNDIAVVAPVIKEFGTLNRGWKIPGVMRSIRENIPLFNKSLKNYKPDYYSGEASIVEVVSGSFLMIKGSVFDDIAMYDEKLFLYYEENVLAVKLKDKGYSTIIVNGCEVLHNHSVSINKSFDSYTKLIELKKSQLYFHQNYGKSNKFNLFMLKLSIFLLLKFYKLLKR